jgi:hypothetical protein
MAEAMTAWTDTLVEAIASAAQPGPMLAPDALQEKLESFDNPLGALVDRDAANEIFGIVDQYLGYVWPVRQSRRDYTDELAADTAAAIRWLIAALSAWRLEDDPKRARLAMIFVVAARLDEEGALWPLLPEVVAENVALASGLVDVLGRLEIRVGPPGRSCTPVLDGEEMEQFALAEAEQDWSKLRYYAERYPYKVDANAVVDQSVRILNRFFPVQAVEAASAVANLGMAVQFATALSLDDTFALATRSASPYLCFATVCRLFNKFWPVRELNPAQEDALVSLLLAVAADAGRWTLWMKAFATNPYLAGLLQKPIGRALVDLEDAALQAYIDAIYIQSSWVGRDDIAVCFATFADGVPLERRQTAWRLMFDRWSQWNFGETEVHGGPTAISLSNVDFAIVGYAVECLSDHEREAYIDGCLDTVGRSEHVWHQSHLDHMRYVYRALSRFQPFGHARGCGTDRARWLWSRNGGYFLDQLDDPFWRLRYNLHNMPERPAHPVTTDSGT